MKSPLMLACISPVNSVPERMVILQVNVLLRFATRVPLPLLSVQVKPDPAPLHPSAFNAPSNVFQMEPLGTEGGVPMSSVLISVGAIFTAAASI